MANNPFQNTALTQGNFGALTGAGIGQYPQDYFTSAPPPGPTWDQLFYFQRHIMDLQAEVIRLQKELDKIKNTKEWLVGPENPGIPDPSPVP